jgi:hypothetical protein
MLHLRRRSFLVSVRTVYRGFSSTAAVVCCVNHSGLIARHCAHVANSVGGFRLAWQLIGSTVLWTIHTCCAGDALGRRRRKNMPLSSRCADDVCDLSLLRRSSVRSAICWEMGDDRIGMDERPHSCWSWDADSASSVLLIVVSRLVDFGGAGPSSTGCQAARTSGLRSTSATRGDHGSYPALNGCVP